MKKWHAAALLAVVTAAAYYPVLAAPLNVLDDMRMANQLASRDVTISEFLFHPFGSYFRPLVLLTWLLDKNLWGLEASFMHLENLLLHLGNVFLVFLIAVRLLPARAGWIVLPAFLAALLFGLHPLNTEAVAWIAGRADLLATLFGLSTLLIALAWRQSPRHGLLCLGLASFALGCLSKETVLFVLPAFLYLVVIANGSTPGGALPRRDKFLFVGSFCALVVIYFGWRHQVLHRADYGMQHMSEILTSPQAVALPGVAAAPSQDRSLPELLWYLSAVSGFYLRKLVYPWPLNFGIQTFPLGYAWLGLLLWGASAWALLQRRGYVGIWLCGLGALGAALLVAAGDVSWTPVAERYMYLPSSAFAILIVMAGLRYRSPAAKSALTFGLLVCLGASAWGTRQRVRIWQDNVLLFQDTLDKSPRLQLAKNQLATAFLLGGEHEKAMALYGTTAAAEDQVASLSPAIVMVENGDLDGARSFLKNRLENPYGFEIEILHRLLRVIELMVNETGDASQKALLYREGVQYLERLHELTHNPFYRYRLGLYQMYLEDRQAARENFLRAYRALPEDSMYKEPTRKLAEGMVD